MDSIRLALGVSDENPVAAVRYNQVRVLGAVEHQRTPVPQGPLSLIDGPTGHEEVLDTVGAPHRP